MPTSIEDRVTLVTGGAGQLGRHVVRKFVREGARVHVPSFADEEEGLMEFLGPEAGAVHVHRDVDLARPDAVDEMVRRIQVGEGRAPQILLNLAGGFSVNPIEETAPSTWDRMWGMNATSVFSCSRAVFPSMKGSGWGRIVNVSAFPALDRGKIGLSAYGAAKAAVLNLTHTLAKEGAGYGITVNAILPSIIDTPANREAMPGADHGVWLPAGEIAEVIAFLASDVARIINGAAIPLTLE